MTKKIQTQNKKLFISHAVADGPVVKSFVTLLESGIGVQPTDIFCSSIKGQGIRPGTDFKSSIHQHLDGATTVVALISENFYNSPFCMCELGGVWLQSKDFIPVLVPPVHFGEMKAVLAGLQAQRINSAEDLDELRDELASRLEITALPTPRWNAKRDEFLEGLSGNLGKIPPSPTVQRTLLENSLKEKEEYADSLREAQAELKKVRELNEKLKKTKDAKAVSGILAEAMDAGEYFETMCTDANVALAELAGITREAIYVSELGEDFFPGNTSEYSWDDAQKPLQYKELRLNETENGVCPNDSNKSVKRADKAVGKLRQWLNDGEAPEEFFEWYSSAYEGETPDLTDRAFWDRHLW
ncbi:toll/interleukin-1 receptor domain-containing protein [Paraburkholderia xenovorans]|uniref:toll/interleukin-1 receptor domain-containing protein n=1 Tax=Paraburkholderia xenovorans TaxID=36873 RepID=UPI0038B7F84D